MVGSRRDPDISDEWNGVFVMTPHDRWLEPDDDEEIEHEECDCCNGLGIKARMTTDGWDEMECPECDGEGFIVLTDAERRQKEFDDFDPPDNDFGDL